MKKFLSLLFQHLEQEKHRLRLQLEVMEEEYEQRVADLKADLSKLRAQLLEVETAARDSERERSALAAGLSEQNQRLAGELEAAAKREAELQSKLTELRSQFDNKRISMRDHVVHLETMRDEVRKWVMQMYVNMFALSNGVHILCALKIWAEIKSQIITLQINIVNDRKQTLERRIGELLGEREGLSYNLDETSERIIALERQTREQETQVGWVIYGPSMEIEWAFRKIWRSFHFLPKSFPPPHFAFTNIAKPRSGA